LLLKKIKMFEKKPLNMKSPDLSKMQVVVIDHRTRIYIHQGADVEAAKERYYSRLENTRTPVTKV